MYIISVNSITIHEGEIEITSLVASFLLKVKVYIVQLVLSIVRLKCDMKPRIKLSSK